MLTTLQTQTIQCPKCKENFSRPFQAATATCPQCGSSVTLIDQIMDRHLVFSGEVITRGKIVISDSGRVKANLSATEIVVDGKVEGNLTAINKITLGGQAKVKGSIVAGALSMAEGASLVGKLEIGDRSDLINAFNS